MAAAQEKPVPIVEPTNKKEKSTSSPKMPLFSKDSKSKSPKKGKDAQANGVELPPTSTSANAAGGSTPAAEVGETGAGVQQGAPRIAPTASTLQPSSSTREGDSSGSHSVEQGTTSTGERDTKEKASLTGTATTSRHQKDKTSETVQSTILSEKSESRLRPTKEKAGKKKKQKSKSIWSKLASAVFKCVSDPSAPAAEPKQAPAPVSEKGKELQPQPSTQAAAISDSTAQVQPPTLELPPVTTIITPPAADTTSPQNEEVDVIVPPSPTKHVLSENETAGLTSGAVVPPGSTGPQNDDSDESSMLDDEEERRPEEEDLEERLILNGGVGIPIGSDGVPRPLLPPIAPQHAGRKCLVLDMDETLLHSSFKSIQHADYVIPVEIEYHWHNVYVIKRPGVDSFLKKMGEIYEVVVFTASLSKYADPVLDKLDVHGVVTHRLFRESCYNHRGSYVKDLSQLGRPMEDTIILDNSPASYIFHPNNAVPVSSWFNDPHDTELTDLCPFLTDLGTVDDVRGVLDGGL